MDKTKANMTLINNRQTIGYRLRPSIADCIYDATKPYYQDERPRWELITPIEWNIRTIITMELKKCMTSPTESVKTTTPGTIS